MDKPKRPTRRQYLAAVVLGSALAAVGPGPSACAHEISGQAIHDISRYCTSCWRNARLPVDRWGDCTQEVLCRLLERLEPRAWELVLAYDSEERKEFTRAIDTVKKRTQRDRRFSELFDTATGDVGERLHEEKEELRQAAARLLSPRQQEILRMAGEGWSIADIAREWALSPERVSDEKYKAIQKLRVHFHAL